MTRTLINLKYFSELIKANYIFYYSNYNFYLRTLIYKLKYLICNNQFFY